MVSSAKHFNVLIADSISEEGILELESSGISVTYDMDLQGEPLIKAVSDIQPNILVVRATKVTAELMNAGNNLQMVVRAGAGVDTIDVNYCSRKGIYVANCPGKNSTAVAELTMGLILSIDRRIAEGVQMLKEGRWNKGMFSNASGIKGKTLGLIGFGSIGELVAIRAKAFDMNILVFTRTKKADIEKTIGFKYVDSIEELLQQSDIVSLHTPSTPETKNMVNKSFLSLMKEDAILINTARGNIVVEEDLLERLETHQNFWYGTDVFVDQPNVYECPFQNQLAQHPRVYGTHYIGAFTRQSGQAISNEVVRIVKKFAQSGTIDNENFINKESDVSQLHKMSIRYLDKIEILAYIFQVFAKNEFNIQELQNVTFKEKDACVVNIRFTGDLSVLDSSVNELRLNANILDVSI